jgi:hypothetical protein
LNLQIITLDGFLDAQQAARRVRGDIGAFSLYFQMTA